MNDLISRQAAIDAVDESLTRVFVEHRDIAEKMINKLPSAQQWIPCSERLPEVNERCLCLFHMDEEQQTEQMSIFDFGA